ncbi:hypothetical protein K502DRAFT_363683 [Neoconidiobolus thromboides FSU 785]|nr:hypothetical protein K502DRAFT_363683 [Neoconidiobolus thromboides FSU 785]
MCDVNQEDLMIPKEFVKSKDQNCIKCKTEKSSLIVRNIRYCKSCFLYNFEGKFRSILNRTRSINDKNCQNMLLAFSGGISSRAMLQLVKNFTTPHNKYGNILVCHIDESIVLDNCNNNVNELESIVQGYNFEYKKINLESIYQQDENENKRRLLELLNSLSNLTEKEDLIQNLKHTLLVQIAKESNSSMLLLGDSSTTIAIKTIALTSKGRGFSLPFEIATESNCYQGVTLIRPMRDSINKEIAMFNYFNQLSTPWLSTIYTKKPGRSSIFRLTEEFIINLDNGFPSTVSTIVRTANKLTPSSKVDAKKWCLLCLNPAEKDIVQWKNKVMLKKLDQIGDQKEEIMDEDGINQYFCYGCTTICEKFEQEKLPNYVIEGMERLKQNN